VAKILLDSTFRNIDELGAVVGWDLDFRQLERGRFRGSIVAVGGHATVLMRVRFNQAFHQRGTAMPGMMTFGVLEPAVRSINWCSGVLNVNDLIDFNVANGFDGVSPANHHAYTFSLPIMLLEKTAEAMGIDLGAAMSRRSTGALLDDSRGTVDRLRFECRQLFDGLRRNHDAVAHFRADDLDDFLATEVLRLIDRTAAEQPAPGPAQGTRICRRALEFIDTYAADAISVADICQAIGVSWSTLERAFRDYLGVTPKFYINALRLSQVRRELHGAGDALVTDVANRWGFWHMGQFARDYRKMFGELPSQTRRMSV